ncbi:hypothetical protein CLUG_01885 [Clavispora lusitaniae ATCC 42720]|uniref:Uncharacterized protein n=1 Tax=Clavispora lusitaniae (strain ATCC 42720) TaxID=306902 RepID=C4Y103_CLAL4|nr:uncharacterized protein CLUG_01885 [Clavispora lusitaniae ATCC 42720]EEQ37761.1 hypothetical protein CLUG_01885 [Clavispora lusitaniae ATCC 42720]
MVRSLDPPPDASNSRCTGHHANAFTAARWVFLRKSAPHPMPDPLPTLPEHPQPSPEHVAPVVELVLRASQMATTLSLPPSAKTCPSERYSRPHTSAACAWRTPTKWRATRTSSLSMRPSLAPVVSMCSSHAWAATRAPAPTARVRSRALVSMSQISTPPSSRPTEMYDPSSSHRKDVTVDPSSSHKRPTAPVEAFHTYTASARPTAIRLVADHATRLR